MMVKAEFIFVTHPLPVPEIKDSGDHVRKTKHILGKTKELGA